MADYSYLARSCGGSHTLTYTNRRYTSLQHITHLIQTEEESQHVPSVPQTQVFKHMIIYNNIVQDNILPILYPHMINISVI